MVLVKVAQCSSYRQSLSGYQLAVAYSDRGAINIHYKMHDHDNQSLSVPSAGSQCGIAAYCVPKLSRKIPKDHTIDVNK